jgi:hypothetical protein
MLNEIIIFVCILLDTDVVTVVNEFEVLSVRMVVEDFEVMGLLSLPEIVGVSPIFEDEVIVWVEDVVLVVADLKLLMVTEVVGLPKTVVVVVVVVSVVVDVFVIVFVVVAILIEVVDTLVVAVAIVVEVLLLVVVVVVIVLVVKVLVVVVKLLVVVILVVSAAVLVVAVVVIPLTENKLSNPLASNIIKQKKEYSNCNKLNFLYIKSNY